MVYIGVWCIMGNGRGDMYLGRVKTIIVATIIRWQLVIIIILIFHRTQFFSSDRSKIWHTFRLDLCDYWTEIFMTLVNFQRSQVNSKIDFWKFKNLNFSKIIVPMIIILTYNSYWFKPLLGFNQHEYLMSGSGSKRPIQISEKKICVRGMSRSANDSAKLIICFCSEFYGLVQCLGFILIDRKLAKIWIYKIFEKNKNDHFFTKTGQFVLQGALIMGINFCCDRVNFDIVT